MLLPRSRAARRAGDFAARRAQYPMTDVVTGDVNIFDPNLQVPYAQTWHGRLAAHDRRATWRSKSATSARARDQSWTDFNYNEINIVENGFLERVPPGAAEPAGEHRGRPRRDTSATRAAARARRRCRSSSPTSAACRRPPPANTANYSSALFAEHDVRQSAGDVQSAAVRGGERARRADAARRRTTRCAPACPRTSSSPIRICSAARCVTTNGGGTHYNALQLAAEAADVAAACSSRRTTATASAYIAERYLVPLRRGRVPRRRRPKAASPTRSASTGSTSCRSAASAGSAATPDGFVDRLIGGWSFDGIGRIQSGRADRLRQRAPRRHVAEGAAGRLQAAVRRRGTA